ncbi:MAG: hypothetical protein QMA97_04860, partial [Glaciecola sp.]
KERAAINKYNPGTNRNNPVWLEQRDEMGFIVKADDGNGHAVIMLTSHPGRHIRAVIGSEAKQIQRLSKDYVAQQMSIQESILASNQKSRLPPQPTWLLGTPEVLSDGDKTAQKLLQLKMRQDVNSRIDKVAHTKRYFINSAPQSSFSSSFTSDKPNSFAFYVASGNYKRDRYLVVTRRLHFNFCNPSGGVDLELGRLDPLCVTFGTDCDFRAFCDSNDDTTEFDVTWFTKRFNIVSAMLHLPCDSGTPINASTKQLMHLMNDWLQSRCGNQTQLLTWWVKTTKILLDKYPTIILKTECPRGNAAFQLEIFKEWRYISRSMCVEYDLCSKLLRNAATVLPPTRKTGWLFTNNALIIPPGMSEDDLTCPGCDVHTALLKDELAQAAVFVPSVNTWIATAIIEGARWVSKADRAKREAMYEHRYTNSKFDHLSQDAVFESHGRTAVNNMGNKMRKNGTVNTGFSASGPCKGCSQCKFVNL